MKGMVEIIEMRMRGQTPGLVNVELDEGRFPDFGMYVYISPNERLYEADLRPLVGLIVAVGGVDSARVGKAAKACQEAGASRVIATTSKQLDCGEFRVIEVQDTEGVFTWKC